jgi:hypothetical protein
LHFPADSKEADAKLTPCRWVCLQSLENHRLHDSAFLKPISSRANFAAKADA